MTLTLCETGLRPSGETLPTCILRAALRLHRAAQRWFSSLSRLSFPLGHRLEEASLLHPGKESGAHRPAAFNSNGSHALLPWSARTFSQHLTKLQLNGKSSSPQWANVEPSRLSAQGVLVDLTMVQEYYAMARALTLGSIPGTPYSISLPEQG